MIYGLHEEISCTGLKGFVADIPVLNGGHHNDGGFLADGIFAKFPYELDAVHLRHLVVSQDEIAGVGFAPLVGLLRIGEALDSYFAVN